LRPTIRAAHSELWFSWNPRRNTDAVDRLLRSAVLPGRATANQNSASTLLRTRASLPRLAGLVCRRPIEDAAHRAWQGVACQKFPDQFNKALDIQANRDSVWMHRHPVQHPTHDLFLERREQLWPDLRDSGQCFRKLRFAVFRMLRHPLWQEGQHTIRIFQMIQNMIHDLLLQGIDLQARQSRSATTLGNVLLRHVLSVNPIAAHTGRPR